ncbi:unnamed protein product [Closterium sp. NIES-53]
MPQHLCSRNVALFLTPFSQSLLPLPPSPVLLPLPSSSQPQHLRSWNVALAKDVMHLSSSPAFCHYPPALLSSFLFPPTQHLHSRNVALAKDAMQLAPQSPSSGAGASDQSQVATSADGAGSAPTHAELEAARRQLAEAEASVATLRGEQETLMGELMQVRQVAAGKEADLQALSMAYHSLEQENLRLEGEVKTLQSTTETLRASLASAEAAAAAAGLGGGSGGGAAGE